VPLSVYPTGEPAGMVASEVSGSGVGAGMGAATLGGSPGVGNGRGTAPDDAQPTVRTVAPTMSSRQPSFISGVMHSMAHIGTGPNRLQIEPGSRVPDCCCNYLCNITLAALVA
jgi:hypothetical protein